MKNITFIGGSGFFGKSFIDGFSRGVLKTYKIKKIYVISRNPRVLKKHKESYEKLFPHNEWRGKIDTILTFGEIIDLLERIFFDIYSIKNDTEIKIIIDENSKDYTLKKEDIICISEICS